MNEPTADKPANQRDAAEPEKVADLKGQWELDRRRWKSRIYLLAAFLPLSFQLGLAFAGYVVAIRLSGGEGADTSSMVALAMFVPLGIMTPLLAAAAYHSHKYKKAGGKKWL